MASLIQVCHLKGWKSCSFSLVPDFVAKTQNPSVYDSCFKEFTVPSLVDFVDGDRNEMLCCLIRSILSKDIKRYLSRMEQFRPECSALFFLITKRKKRVSQNTISFFIRSVISHADQSATGEDCRAVTIKAHKIWKIGTSLLLRKNFVVQQVLKGKDWYLVIADDLLSHILSNVTTGIWIPSSSALWWLLKRFCSSGVVTCSDLFWGGTVLSVPPFLLLDPWLLHLHLICDLESYRNHMYKSLW